MSAPKILISIVAYKEPELVNTVRRLYADAELKDRLIFSVVCQDDKFPRLSSIIPAAQLRYIRVFPGESWGVCWARSIAQSHFSDYDYYLQVDAHMFSEANWDTKIIESFLCAEKLYNKPVLTAYPAMYSITRGGARSIGPSINHGASLVHTASHYSGKTIWPEVVALPEYTPTHYIQGACLFSAREFVEDVPIDPEIDFYFEEITLSIRAWCLGFTVVSFNKPIFYHLFQAERAAAGMDARPWNDGNKNARALSTNTRGVNFMRGELSGIYGVTLEQLNNFKEETGYRDK